jgi:ABC-type nitrate/sulfonate/bicarbonate transport system ATPase subunit
VGRITLDAVTKDYRVAGGKRLRVLENLSFDVGHGAFISILGPSGCGKSTILNLIAGLDTHTSGSISIDGKVVQGVDPRDVGFVFQQPRLLNWRTVAANVALPLETRIRDKAEQRRVADRYLRLVGLADYSDYYPLQLSGGMQQRVAIARALAIDSDILLMDEPFSGLDELTARRLRQELMRIWQETAKTILFVTHSLSESVFLSQEVLIVSHKPATIYKRVPVYLPYPRTYGDLRLFEIETALTQDFLRIETP